MLRRENGQPLGSLAFVQKTLFAVFPSIAFEWSPSGREKLAHLDAQGIALPEMVRRVLGKEPSAICGEVETDSFLASFNLGSRDPVEIAWVQVNGDVTRVSHCWEALRLSAGWELTLEGD